MRSRLVWGALAVSIAISHDAWGQSSDQKALAENLFEEGRALLVSGDYAAACPKLAESQRIDPSIGTALYLGACYEKSGKTASAWATFKEAQQIADRQGDAKRGALAQQRAAALEPTLARLVVNVKPEARAPGLAVTRDGIELTAPVWGSAVPIDPGTHKVDVTAPHKQTFSVAVVVKEGVTTVDVPTLEDAPVKAPPPVVTKPPPKAEPRLEDSRPPPDQDAHVGDTQRTVGIILGGAGVASIVVGIAAQVHASSLVSSAGNLGCDTNARPVTCPDDAQGRSGLSKMDDAKNTWRPVTITGFALGGALLGGGAVLYFIAPRARNPAVGIAPMFDPHGGGLWLSGAL